jgi:tRNA(adenine34) deaminase
VDAEREFELMGQALDIAREAGEAGEVPVGCVIELDGRVIGRGANRTRQDNDPTAHAEILALRQAAAHSGDFRLENARMFVTLEPCLMCLGAILIARISWVYFGAPEPKFGALKSRFSLMKHERFRKITFRGGMRTEEALELVTKFFADLRHGDTNHEDAE